MTSNVKSVSIVYLGFLWEFLFIFFATKRIEFPWMNARKKVWHGNGGWSNFLWLNFDSKIVSHAYIYTFSFISSLCTCTGGVCMGKRNSTCKLYYVQKWNRVYFFFDSIDSQCEFILIVKYVCAFRLSQRTDRKIDATRMRWQGLFPCQIKQNKTQKCAFKIYSNSSLRNIIYFLPGFGSFYGRSPFFLLLCYCLLM